MIDQFAHILDDVTLQFLNALRHDAKLVTMMAFKLFYYLVVIQVAWMGIQMMRAGETLQVIVGKLTMAAFGFAMLFGLMQNGGHWIPALLNYFVDVGRQGGLHSLDPASIMLQGFSIAGAILDGFLNWGLLTHPFVSIIASAVCIAIIVLYAFIASDLAVILVNTYFLISVGGLFYSFGATEVTRPMTKRYFNGLLGNGLQLMTLYLLLGVGQYVGKDWADITAKAASSHELMPMFAIAVAVCVYYKIIKSTPSYVASLAGFGGFQAHGDTAIGMAANAGLLTANTVAQKGMRGAQGLTEAGGIMSKAVSHGLHQKSVASGGRFNQLGKFASASMGAVASSTGKAVKDHLTRQHQQQSFGQKLNRHLSNTVSKNTSNGKE